MGGHDLDASDTLAVLTLSFIFATFCGKAISFLPPPGVGGHDLDASDMRARLAAAHVFHRLLPADER